VSTSSPSPRIYFSGPYELPGHTSHAPWLRTGGWFGLKSLRPPITASASVLGSLLFGEPIAACGRQRVAQRVPA
jgi:hypothetical protein